MIKFFKHTISTIMIIFLLSCQVQEPTKVHGLLFLKNKANQLQVNSSNFNDALKIMGQPHTKSIKDENTWIYFERILTKGKYHQLGKTVIKDNNSLVLKFNNRGILIEKNIYDLDNYKEIKVTQKTTKNEITSESFVEKFLSSITKKMYRNR